MTNEELDEICCEFAGIERIGGGHKFVPHPNHPDTGWCLKCFRVETDRNHAYPPVSTDWAAAGRLMDALRIKHVWISIQSGTGWSVKVGVSPSMSAEAAELGLPMALALAVAQLVASHESRNP